MPDHVASEWVLNFYFLVEFQNKVDRFQASFTEVSGLDMHFDTAVKPSDAGIWIKMPGGVKYGDITLKRPVPSSNNDIFTQWIYKCLKADRDKKMLPYDMIIKLLNQEGKPVVGWICSHAFPLHWSLSNLEAENGKLAMDTVVMTCNRIDRIKI